MASNDLPENPLDSTQTLEFIRSALHPDERQFFKQYLGQESPDVMDYLLPQGRFAKARDIRESIVRGVLSNLIPSATNPQATLGEARSINPDFPAPPNALKYGEAQGPGAPVSTGVYPGQGMSPEQLNAPTAFGTMGDSVSQLSPSGPAFVKEGPRPTTPVPVEDMNTLLPIAHQHALQADIHKLGLRGFSPNSMVKSELIDKHNMIATGQIPEEYPGQLKELKSVLGMVTKAPAAGSNAERKQAADANLAEQKNARYAGLTDQQIATMKARETADMAKANDLSTLLDTRQRELESRITKNNAQGKAAGDLLGLNKEKANIQASRLLLAIHKFRMARENVDQESQDKAMNEILDLGGSAMELKRDQPGFFQDLFSNPGDSHLVPRSNIAPIAGQPPSGNPMQFPNGSITSPAQGDIVNPEPITNVQPVPPTSDPEARKAYMRTMYSTMKDGEVKVLDGKKFQRKGNQLIEVK